MRFGGHARVRGYRSGSRTGSRCKRHLALSAAAGTSRFGAANTRRRKPTAQSRRFEAQPGNDRGSTHRNRTALDPRENRLRDPQRPPDGRIGGRGVVSHSSTRPPVLRERIIAGLLEILERLAFSLLPRGPLRKRLLGVVDRTYARMHRQSCNKNRLL